MKIIIDIPEDVYEKSRKDKYVIYDKIYYAIKNGTPLPKGHGDLITKGQAVSLVEFYQLNPQHFNFENLIDDIDNEISVIKADKEE